MSGDTLSPIPLGVQEEVAWRRGRNDDFAVGSLGPEDDEWDEANGDESGKDENKYKDLWGLLTNSKDQSLLCGRDANSTGIEPYANVSDSEKLGHRRRDR